MNETIKLKEASPLVQSVVAFDHHISELERIGNKLEELELKSEFDFQMARKLLVNFVEHGKGISEEVLRFSDLLNQARERASAVSERVNMRSSEVSGRDAEQQSKYERFRILAEKVRAINTAMATLRPPEGQTISDEDRKSLFAALMEFDAQLIPLVEEAESLRKEAHESKMKELEQNADSLAQTLTSVRKKVRDLGPGLGLVQ